MALVIGCLAYFDIAEEYRNVWDGSMLILFGLTLPVCSLFVFAFANRPLSDLNQEDTVQLDGYTYSLARQTVYDYEFSTRDRYALFRCDRWGIVCHRIYDKEEWWSPAHLQTDPTAHTVSLVLDDEVVYTYHAAE